MVGAYYWAGKGSAIIHRLKGFTFGIDDEAYSRAYDLDRLRWLRADCGVDLAFLSYNWGLPPEIESEDWRAFELATSRAHALGMRVAAYVQPSNAASMGSYANKDWYALSAKKRRIPYYNGRFFTCLNHPEWRTTVFERVAGALDAGADAIFLDNCAFGGMPVPLARDYTAFAGCYCARCHSQYGQWRKVRGLAPTGVPRLFRPGRDPNAREYAHWRAWVLTSFLREIKDLIVARKSEAILLTNTVGAVNVNTYHVFGVDLPELAQIVDYLFVENLQSPRAEKGLLVQNAGTFKLLESLKPGRPAFSISYERGIGVDGVPGPEAFARTAAEAFAAGGNPVFRATEYIEEQRWTLLQPSRAAREAAAWDEIVEFVRSAPAIFEASRAASPVAVLVPPGLAWRGDVFPREGADYLAVIQALVGAAIPFRVVGRAADAPGASLLLVPEGIQPPVTDAAVMHYLDLGIKKRRHSLFDWFAGPIEPAIRVLGPRVIDGYYSRVRVRRFVDRLDLLFRLVFKDQFEPLQIASGPLDRLRGCLPVAVISDTPVFADLRENRHGMHLHLVNYGDASARVRLDGRMDLRDISVSTPRGARAPVTGLEVERYAVVSWAHETDALSKPAIEAGP